MIQSVTLLSDTNNTLNKGDNVQGVFKQKKKIYGNLKPRYFYTPFRNEDKDEDIKVTPCDENSNIGEVFDRIKNYGVDINKDGDGFQLVKTLGDFKPKDMNEHLGKARKLSRFPDDTGRIPETYYYKTQASDAKKGGESGEPELKGLIESVTIKRDPNNTIRKNKNVSDVFNEDEIVKFDERIKKEIIISNKKGKNKPQANQKDVIFNVLQYLYFTKNIEINHKLED